MRVSYTRLDTYTQCPRKYKFYIDKAPQDPSRTLALRFGSAVHKALEFAYAKRYKGPSEERVIEYYRKLMAVAPSTISPNLSKFCAMTSCEK